MARVFVHEQNREISDPQQISEFLAPLGIWYEKWDIEGRIDDAATSEEILAEYAPEIERLKQRGGYVTADVIAVTPETPNLDVMLNKFNKEHMHSEDEVRFTVKGRGVFHIHPEKGPVFGIQVESGDLINVPAGTRHWFDLCEDRTIRCIRLFLDTAGWSPLYVENGVHHRFSPMCFGPQYFVPSEKIESGVRL